MGSNYLWEPIQNKKVSEFKTTFSVEKVIQKILVKLLLIGCCFQFILEIKFEVNSRKIDSSFNETIIGFTLSENDLYLHFIIKEELIRYLILFK